MCTFSINFSVVSHDGKIKINEIILFVWCHNVDRRAILKLPADLLVMEQVDGNPSHLNCITQKCHRVE